MISEDHPYVAPRLRLLQALAEYGPGSMGPTESVRARDKTTALVQRWQQLRDQERQLRADTLQCVTFTAKGKVEVHDSEALEGLNQQIADVASQRAAIEKAVVLFSAQAPEFLTDLINSKREAKKTLENGPFKLSHQLGTELKSFHAKSVEEAMQSHRYQDLKKNVDAVVAGATAKLEVIEPKIKLIEEQLATIEELIGPLKVIPGSVNQYSATITRSKAGGMA